MKLLNAGCGTHYANGWTNVDVWEGPNTTPDVKVNPGEPYPFEDNSFDAVYLGHVLEHIPWKDVPTFLKDIQRVAKKGAPILVVGPDVFKTIQRWKDGLEPWSMVLSTIEHQDMNWQPDREHEWWDGAHHHWNCHEERIETLLSGAGFLKITNVFSQIPDDPAGKSWYDEDFKIEWPVVGKYYWQLCYRAINPL
jgi:predicted SAM-dependent methyltransferase